MVALMLEANPQLGYRDVQEILAYSARPRGESTRHDFSDSSGRSELGWEENGAHNWNAGGLNFNHRYGFGTVDAFAAVRLAETWRPGNDAATYANLERLNYAENGVNGTIPDGTSEFVDQIRVGAEGDVFEIDHLELFVDITHPRISDLVVKLTSPSGTESLLLNRPFKNPDDPAAPPETDMSDLKFTLASVQHWGEMAGGTWTLSVADRQGGEIGTVNDWHLTLYGDKHNGDDHYVFTDDFALVTGGTRGLVDPSGVDTINISPISDNVTFFLNPGSSNIIGESILKIGAATVLENVYAGDGNDTIFGNAADNTLHGGRGNDVLAGAGGADFLRGGPGNDKLHGGPGGDWLEGGPGADHFRFMLPQDSNIAEIDGIMGFKAGVDKIDLSQMDANPGKLGHQQFDFYGRIDLEWWEEDGNRITDDYIDQALVWWQETDEQGDWTYIVGARTKDDGNNADDFAVVLEGFHAIDTDSFAANSLIAV